MCTERSCLQTQPRRPAEPFRALDSTLFRHLYSLRRDKRRALSPLPDSHYPRMLAGKRESHDP